MVILALPALMRDPPHPPNPPHQKNQPPKATAKNQP